MKKKRETNQQHNTAKNNNTQFIATIDVHVFVEMLNRKKAWNFISHANNNINTA